MTKKEYQHLWYLKNKERLSVENKLYRDIHKEEICERRRLKYKKNKVKIRKQRKIYRELNKERIAAQKRKYSLTHKEHIKQYRLEHKEEIKQAEKKYHQIHKLELSRKHNEYTLNKIKTDLNYKLSHYLRTRIRLALRNNQKSGHTLETLGCSVDFLKQHLESKFKPGMSWDNWGLKGWHVDHIRPCASFDLSNPDEQKKCFHYTNLQPLWAEENLSKNDKII